MNLARHGTGRRRLVRGLAAIVLAVGTLSVAAPTTHARASSSSGPCTFTDPDSNGFHAYLCGYYVADQVGSGSDETASIGCTAVVLNADNVASSAVLSTGVGCGLFNIATGQETLCACNNFLPGNASFDQDEAQTIPAAGYQLCVAYYYVTLAGQQVSHPCVDIAI